MRACVLGLTVVFALGCGNGRRFAPVTGKVTLNGVPLVNAMVSFQPIAPKGSIDAGPGSSGTTNKDGDYTLKTDTDQPGAVVGNHRVIITLLGERAGSDERGKGRGVRLASRVPAKYNDGWEIEVKAGEENVKDFPLTDP